MLASRQRRVEAAGLTEGPLQAVGRAEHAALALDVVEHRLAGVGHVLAEDADALVGRHQLVQRALDRLAQRHRLAALVAVGRCGRWSGSTYDVLGDRGRVGPGAPPAPRRRPWPRSPWPRPGSRRPARRVSTPPSTSSASSRTIGSCLRLVGQLLGGAVLGLGVGRRVRVRAGDVGVDEGRADAGPHVLDDRAGLAADLEVVGAVEAVDVEAAEAGDQLGHRRRGSGRCAGTEMAKPLSATTYSTGRWRLQAVFRLSQNSPSLHAPSPRLT